MISPKILLSKALLRLNALFGRGLVMSMSVVVLFSVALSLAAFVFLSTAAPRTLTIASGPPGSLFQRNAERYQKILEREGVTLKIVPSEGSADNLAKLADAKQKVDLGFVLGGEAKDAKYENLMSLGSVAFQPLMVFYSGVPKTLLSEFKGMRIGDQALLPQALFREMSRNQLADGVDGPLAYTGSGSGFGFGLGLAVRLDQGPAAMPCAAGELAWSGISGTALFVNPREQWFAICFTSNMVSRMMARLEFRRALTLA